MYPKDRTSGQAERAQGHAAVALAGLGLPALLGKAWTQKRKA